MASERDMLNLLGERYTKLRPGTMADRFVRAEHVRNRLGHEAQAIADFIALDKYPGYPYGSGLAIHWHEVKVSRSDWLTELRQPEKSEAFTRYVHYRWLVVPTADIVAAGELPQGWGLLVTAGKRLRAKVSAVRHEPAPLPLDFSISLAAAAQRTGARELAHRDAPTVHITTWDPKCAVCGVIGPCEWHQPRAHRAAKIEEDTP